MTEPRSEWSLTASCTSCRGTLSLASTAVLLRSSLLGPRGVVLDVLGERWPEPGMLIANGMRLAPSVQPANRRVVDHQLGDFGSGQVGGVGLGPNLSEADSQGQSVRSGLVGCQHLVSNKGAQSVSIA